MEWGVKEKEGSDLLPPRALTKYSAGPEDPKGCSGSSLPVCNSTRQHCVRKRFQGKVAHGDAVKKRHDATSKTCGILFSVHLTNPF